MSDKATLRVASERTLLYTPQYVAEALGFYVDEGLSVLFQEPSVPQSLDVLEGDVDIRLDNVALALRFWKGPSALSAFAQNNQQCRYLAAVRRENAPEKFEWSDVKDKVLVLPSHTPTPWIALREVLREQGVSLDEVRPVIGYTPKLALHEFLGGIGDYLVIDGELAQNRELAEVAALAETLGPVPWSVYCVQRNTPEKRAVDLERFRRALGRGQAWVAEHESDEIAAVVSSMFGEFDVVMVGRVIQRYKDLELWPAAAGVNREQVERWQEILLRWGLLPSPAVVDEVIALTG